MCLPSLTMPTHRHTATSHTQHNTQSIEGPPRAWMWSPLLRLQMTACACCCRAASSGCCGLKKLRSCRCVICVFCVCIVCVCVSGGWDTLLLSSGNFGLLRIEETEKLQVRDFVCVICGGFCMPFHRVSAHRSKLCLLPPPHTTYTHTGPACRPHAALRRQAVCNLRGRRRRRSRGA